jgi:hypothetical protein
MVNADRLLRLVTFGRLAVAAVLLLWPISRPEAFWAVTVGTNKSGFVPVSSKTITPVEALVSGLPLWVGSDRLRIAAGLVFVGVGIGAGLALFVRRREHGG